jgi:hypothetical protein
VQSLTAVLHISLSPPISIETDGKKARERMVAYGSQIRKVLRGEKRDFFEIGHDMGVFFSRCKALQDEGLGAEFSDDDRIGTFGYLGRDWVTRCRKLGLPQSLVQDAERIVYQATRATNVMDAVSIILAMSEWQVAFLSEVE